MMRKFAVVVALTFGACSNNASVNVKNVAPTGTVGGILYDAAADMPLAGATVTFIAAGKQVGTATTGSDGLYSTAGVPAGDYIVNFQKMGYVSAMIDGTLNGAIGNFPVSNPSSTVTTIGLVPSTGAFTVKLLDDSAKPLANVTLTGRPQIRYVEYDEGARVQKGNYSVLATTDTNGNAVFSGLPDYTKLGLFDNTDVGTDNTYYTKLDRLWIDVPPIQDSMSGVYAFEGLTTYFDVLRVATTVPTISLAGPNDTLTIVDSNIQYLIGMTPTSSRTFYSQEGSTLAQSSPYYVLFNTAIDSNVRVSLTDEFGAVAPVTLSAAVAGNLLTVTPMVTTMGPLPGKRYNLVLSVLALSQPGANSVGTNTKELSVTAPFWITSMQPNVTAAQTVGALTIAKTGSDIILTFQLSEQIGVGGGSTGVLGCVAFYEGADFDGDATTSSRGEYGSSLSCQPPPGAVGPDVSQIRPVFPTDTNTPNTGFYSTWQVTVDQSPGDGGCKPAFATCVRPQAGKKLYLIFNKLDSSNTVRRADGRPVTNQIEITLPTFPS